MNVMHVEHPTETSAQHGTTRKFNTSINGKLLFLLKALPTIN